MTDGALFGQLRAYATQLDELPARTRIPAVAELQVRPPRRSRRVWIAVAAAVAVTLAFALPRVLDRSDGTKPSVGTGGAIKVTRGWTRDLGEQADRVVDAPGGRTIVDLAPENTGDSALVALDRASGKVLWRHHFPSRNGPWGLDGNVLVAGVNGRTAGIDVRTGKQLWLVDVNAVSGEQAPPILVHDHVAYLVGGDDGVMTALHVPTHRVQWRQTLGGTVLVTPVATKASIVAAVSPLPLDGRPGRLVVMNRLTGSVYDPIRPTGGKDVRGLTVAPDGSIAVTAGPFAGSAPALVPSALTIGSPSTGCSIPIDGVPSNPVVDGTGEVVLATDQGYLSAYRCDVDGIGRPLWQRKEVGVSQSPSIEGTASGLVVAGYGLSGVVGSPASFRWTAPPRDAYFPAPAAGDVVVAISRADGRLYVVDARDGRVVKTVRDGTSLTGVTLRDDSIVTASDRGVVTGYPITQR